MALFKVYHGDKDDLPGELKDSYGYIVVNDEAEAGSWTDDNDQEQSYGIGEWYIDTNYKRYRIAAAQLIDEEGNLVTLDDLVQKDNLADDFIDAVWDSTLSQSRLPSVDQAKIRNAISVIGSDDAITKAYNITLSAGLWEPDPVFGEYYKYDYTLPETLHCGKGDASSTVVPPIVVWSGLNNQDLYDLIVDVQLNDAKNVITFRIEASDYSRVNSGNITVTVIDHR